MHWLSECLRLEETFGGHLVQPHWSNRDKVSCPGLCSVRILISLKMEILQVLWANCQCLTTLTLKKFYILFRQHLLCFSLSIVSSSITEHHWKEPDSIIFSPSLQVFINGAEILPNLLFSRLNSPSSLSPSSQEGCSNPFIIFVALSVGLSQVNSHLAFLGEPKTGHHTSGLTGTEQRGRITSLYLLATSLTTAQGTCYPSLPQQCTLLDHSGLGVCQDP